MAATKFKSSRSDDDNFDDAFETYLSNLPEEDQDLTPEERAEYPS